MRDERPPIPGLEAEWGRRVAQCPFCHGHEFAGRERGQLAVAVTRRDVRHNDRRQRTGLVQFLVPLFDCAGRTGSGRVGWRQ